MAGKAYRAVDIFCGAGGSSCGARAAGVEIVAGFDLWELAGKVYADNNPSAAFVPGLLESHSDADIRAKCKNIDLLLASPECTNHSVAKGAKRRCEKSRETAFQVTRFAKLLEPRWIVIENVVSMRQWARYDEFKDDLNGLGYNIREQVLNAADFGVPQARKRLFLICDLEHEPEDVLPTPRTRRRTAASVIDQNGAYPYSPLKTETRAKATLERAARAMAEVGNDSPFLIVYYGSDYAGGWQRMDHPLRTVTTLDRFAFVKPHCDGHQMRMLQVPELKRAMGFPASYQITQGTRRDRVKMMGNAVCPPVMKRVLRALIRCKPE